ncbi:unnamed protein product [Soboliphyme baturini]|uniref:C3H1-type domain-containing protein n=1 Tax=Soboliphyme baturini TaxID=241478 RepID=A0A183J495_9BILA|nr:unnamed protein product [Soboliphyme baturini]
MSCARIRVIFDIRVRFGSWRASPGDASVGCALNCQLRVRDSFGLVDLLASVVTVRRNALFVVNTDYRPTSDPARWSLSVFRHLEGTVRQRRLCWMNMFAKLYVMYYVEVSHDNRVTICRDFAKGKCTRTACKYYHVPVISDGVAVANNNGGVSMSTELTTGGSVNAMMFRSAPQHARPVPVPVSVENSPVPATIVPVAGGMAFCTSPYSFLPSPCAYPAAYIAGQLSPCDKSGRAVGPKQQQEAAATTTTTSPSSSSSACNAAEASCPDADATCGVPAVRLYTHPVTGWRRGSQR